jgi:hypothetical protein
VPPAEAPAVPPAETPPVPPAATPEPPPADGGTGAAPDRHSRRRRFAGWARTPVGVGVLVAAAMLIFVVLPCAVASFAVGHVGGGERGDRGGYSRDFRDGPHGDRGGQGGHRQGRLSGPGQTAPGQGGQGTSPNAPATPGPSASPSTGA